MNITDFTRKEEVWTAFWQKEKLNRPVMCVTSPLTGDEVHMHRSDDNACAHAIMGTSEVQKKHLDSYLKMVDTTYYGGESIPHMNITLGPDQYAAFLGAELTIKDDHFTTWVNSCVDTWEGFETKLHDDPDSYLRKIIDFIKYAVNRSEDKFIVSMLDLHSNMDAMSALRSPQELCFDLMDEPELVHKVLDDINKTYPVVLDRIYEAGDMKRTGSIGWAPTYCPPSEGRFAVVQCDFSCLISPDQAREFVIPALREEISHLDRCVYHYDGKGALGHLDDILAIPGIDVIQWVPGDGQPRTIEWMDLLRKIQNAGKGLWLYDWSPQEIIEHRHELSHEGVVFSVWLGSRSEADEFLARMGPAM